MPQVYLFECEGKFKIGHSIDVEQRRRALLTGNPHEIRVLHTIPTKHAKRLEKEFHQRFQSKRLRNEWFDISVADVAEFSNYVISMLTEQLEHERKINLELIKRPVVFDFSKMSTKDALRLMEKRVDIRLAVMPFLTFNQAHRLFNVPEQHLRDAVKNGELKAVKQGRAQQVRADDVRAWRNKKFED